MFCKINVQIFLKIYKKAPVVKSLFDKIRELMAYCQTLKNQVVRFLKIFLMGRFLEELMYLG